MYQGLVLVDLRVRSMTSSRMPHVCVRRTVAGAPRRQELLHAQKAPSRVHELRRWDNPGRVDGSLLQEGEGTWSRLASLLSHGETSRLRLPLWGARTPRGCRPGELFQRRDVPVMAYQLP